jgi:hypothetical protein
MSCLFHLLRSLANEQRILIAEAVNNNVSSQVGVSLQLAASVNARNGDFSTAQLNETDCPLVGPVDGAHEADLGDGSGKWKPERLNKKFK